MCGIAGYLSSTPVDDRVLADMVDALWHRGPDASGFHHSPPYAAGMRRLSINDLVTGHQPLFDEDRSVVLFYNGEIYNSPQLRRELESRGVRFRTRSDGEVICHLYRDHGERLFEQLDGMFAAALWIPAERKLILARDLPGEKPLYYGKLAGGGIAFASELKSLRRFPGLDLSLDAQALWDFPTFLWIPEPRTIHRGIKALPRGHLLVADPAGIRVEPYANRFNTEPLASTDDAAIAEETRRVVLASVRSRLLSDVPVGCFLSSGLDSSIVATVAARERPSLSTFTIGFEDVEDPYHGRANESEDAARYAQALGTVHHTIHVTADDFRRSLPDFCRFGDQPFAVSSGLGVLAVSKAARDAGVKVLLSGDGADEGFGGYSWYPLLEDLPPSGEPASESGSASLQDLDSRAALAALARYGPHKRAWAMHYWASEDDKRRLYDEGFFGDTGVGSSLRHFERFRPERSWSAEDYVSQDRAFYLPNEMLTKVDRMTMANSVEGRVPFVAPAVLSHAAKLRWPHLVRGDTLKWALREAFSDLLPREIVRRPKHGFNVPVDRWLRSSWRGLVDEAFGGDSALARAGLIGRKSAKAARAMLADDSRLTGHTLFSFIMLNLWLSQ